MKFLVKDLLMHNNNQNSSQYKRKNFYTIFPYMKFKFKTYSNSLLNNISQLPGMIQKLNLIKLTPHPIPLPRRGYNKRETSLRSV